MSGASVNQRESLEMSSAMGKKASEGLKRVVWGGEEYSLPTSDQSCPFKYFSPIHFILRIEVSDLVSVNMSSILMNIEQWIWSKMKNILKNSWIWNITYLRIWSKMNGENALDPVLVNLVRNVLTSQLGRHANQKSHLRLLFRTPNCCFRYFKPTWDVTPQSGDDDAGIEFVKCFTPAWYVPCLYNSSEKVHRSQNWAGWIKYQLVGLTKSSLW